MLAYLLVKKEARREELISLFWGDLPEQKARNAFRQTLHRLRKGLGESLVAKGSGSIGIATGDSVSADIFSFEQALQRSAFDDALALYSGPFLQGLELGERDFDNWVLGERARLEARYQWALEQAITAASTAGATEDALAKATLLTGSAPFAASAALTLSSLLIAAGRTAEARSSLDRFAQRYRDEFGEEPPHEIRESLGRLRKDLNSSPSSGLEPERRVLIGRDSEMARLLAVWTDTRAGNGNLVLLEGPDGIGKTALVEEFLSRISKIGSLLPLIGRERSSGAMMPYASLGQALRGVLAAPGLAGASQHLLAEAARLLPELRDQFDLPPVQNVEDEASQLRFYEGVAALLDAVAYEQPVCLVLDDFHSAAPGTVHLVEYLCGRLASVAVSIVVVFRSSSVPPTMAARFPFGLQESSRTKRTGSLSIPVTRISIPPLELLEAEALARTVADEDVLPAEECHRIAGLSGGVPFRVLDLARQAAGGLRISALPATLGESLWARLQGCSPAQQRLFVACALIERPASIKLLAGASHLSEGAAFDAVLALEARGLLRQTPQGVAPEHHEAAQFALMGTGPAGRALLAGWAADALAAEPNARPAELAHLFDLAGNKRECFKYAIAAAYEAVGMGEQKSADHFLGIAESAAATPADRTKIDKVRQLFEPAQRRLPSGETTALGDIERTKSATRQGSREVESADASKLSVRVLLATLLRSPPIRITGTISLGVLLALAGLKVNRMRTGIRGPVLSDTLFILNRSTQTPQVYFVLGEMGPGKAVPQLYSGHAELTWMDSLALPYMNPVRSPSGSLVAVERMRDTGPDILMFGAGGNLIKEIAAGPADDIIAGWSPDGKWVLATRGRSIANGSYDADLFAISPDGNRRLALDTATSRSVVEAVWSPDGTHIAWTARVGATHQQEVFVASSDGTGRINISNSAEEDYHIAWSPNGGRIAFTSNRYGNADIFAYELNTKKLWRLTGDPGQDDYAIFSPDGNFVAYESTAGGMSSVYAIRPWGGNPFRIAGGTNNFTIASWGKPSPANSHMENVRILASRQIPVSRTVAAGIQATNSSNMVLEPPDVTWMNLDPALLDLTIIDKGGDEAGNNGVMITGLKPGLARVAISAGGWRADTALFRVGNSRIDLISDDFANGLSADRWTLAGDPSPAVISVAGGKELSARSSRQRESGVLSRARLPLFSGFFARVTVRAPLGEPTAPRSFSVALVVPDSNAKMTRGRKQTRLATIEWIGQAARISYSVDRETWTEPVGLLGARDVHVFEILVDDEGKVAFSVDGQQRWKSRLKIPADALPGLLWLGSQGSADRVSFDNVHAGLTPTVVRRR